MWEHQSKPMKVDGDSSLNRTLSHLSNGIRQSCCKTSYCCWIVKWWYPKSIPTRTRCISSTRSISILWNSSKKLTTESIGSKTTTLMDLNYPDKQEFKMIVTESQNKPIKGDGCCKTDGTESFGSRTTTLMDLTYPDQQELKYPISMINLEASRC